MVLIIDDTRRGNFLWYKKKLEATRACLKIRRFWLFYPNQD